LTGVNPGPIINKKEKVPGVNLPPSWPAPWPVRGFKPGHITRPSFGAAFFYGLPHPGEIAEKEEVTRRQVSNILEEMADLPTLPKLDQAVADYLVDLIVKIPIVALLRIVERSFHY